MLPAKRADAREHMKTPVTTFALAAALLSILTFASASETPVPSGKPLGSAGRPAFIEGVDVPEAKPRTGIPVPTRPPAAEERTPERLAPDTTDGTPNDNEAEAAETSVGGDEEPELTDCTISGAMITPLDVVVESGSAGTTGCGIVDPVLFTGVRQGAREITFTSPLTVSCGFAETVTKWLLADVAPAADRLLKAPPLRISTGPGYQCRRRNNRADGKLSEHAFGRAVDITRFEFDGGTSVSVTTDWSENSAPGRFLKAVHASACKRFTTVLGPDADPNHKSHFHLDTGCHGRECTYIICQ